jgi:hypothetical protein
MKNEPSPPLLFGIIAVILLVVFLRKSAPFEPEEVRRRKLAALAQELRLQFSSKSDFKLAERFLFLTWLKRGDVRYAYNVMCGYHLDSHTVLVPNISTTGTDRSCAALQPCIVSIAARKFSIRALMRLLFRQDSGLSTQNFQHPLPSPECIEWFCELSRNCNTHNATQPQL